MSIVDRLLGRKEMNGHSEDDSPALVVTPGAQEKIRAVLQSQDPPAATIRVSSPFRGKYAMNLEPDGTPAPDDAVVECDGFRVLVGGDSIHFVRGASVDWMDTPTGGGFQFENPNDAPPRTAGKSAPDGSEGDFWREVASVVDAEINPSVAMHGGRIEIMEVREKDVFIKMSGGCQGCGQASMTLRAGVERILREHFPDLGEIYDTTDHAGGRNPYYAPAGH